MPLGCTATDDFNPFQMIAVVQVGGHQALVTSGEVISIDKINAEVGATVELPVMLLSDEDGENCQIGAPVLEGVTVKAKVLEHGRDKKIVVFKMKPRKRYRRTQGHRQDYTLIEIEAFGGASKKAAKKAETKTEETSS